MSNPLLAVDRLPSFSAIQAEHVEPALDQVLDENRQWLTQRLQEMVQPSWDNLIYPLDELRCVVKMSDQAAFFSA